jgi:hypothetical protein
MSKAVEADELARFVKADQVARRYAIKSATVAPIDRGAGRSFPIAGMHSFHSSGEHCCDGPLCHSQIRASAQTATARRRAAGDNDRLSLLCREVISLPGVRPPRCDTAVRSTTKSKTRPQMTATTNQRRRARHHEGGAFVQPCSRGVIDAEPCPRELGREAPPGPRRMVLTACELAA